jgi:nitrogen fixation NifU-like protein
MAHPVYSETFLDHFQHPRNVGELPPPAITIEVSNPVCGDILRLSAQFTNGVVTSVAYKARGCTASIAAGSALTEWMHGKSHSDLAALQPTLVDEVAGGLIPESKHVAVLCVDAVKKLLRHSGSQ